MKHLAWKVLGSALLLGVVIDALFYQTHQVGINVLLAQIAVLLVIGALLRATSTSVSKKVWVPIVFSLLFAATFAIWTSGIGLALSTLGILVSNFYLILFLFGHHGKFHHPLHIAIDGIRYGAEATFTRLGILSDLTIPKMSLRNSAVLRGLVILLPLMIIFGALFLGSDLVLQQQTSNIEAWLDNFLSSSDLVAHFFIISILTVGFLIIFAATFWKRLSIDGIKELIVRHNVESAIVLAGLNVLFIAFIAFQGFYLFGGAAAWDSIEGITYSEYAVNGFNELAAVSALVILLILTLRYFHTERSARKSIHIAEILLIVQTLLIVFSAWQRMSLYVAQYDFTPARLFGFWFFITAGILLLLLAGHILTKAKNYKYLQQAPIVLGILMLAFTASSPDALSVRMNIARAESMNIDAFPLFNNLSAEAFPIMKRVLESEEYQPELTTDPASFCDNVVPYYSSYNDGALISLDPMPGSNENPWNDYRAEVNELEWFIEKWNELDAEATYQGDSAEPVIYEAINDFRTWNVARSKIQKNEDETIDLTIDTEFLTITDVADACNFATETVVENPPISPPDRY